MSDLNKNDTNNNTLLVKNPNFLSANSSSCSDITDYNSIISQAKPAAILVNECGEIEIQMNKNHSYFYVYELIFRTDKEDSVPKLITDPDNNFMDKLCCFTETNSGSLLLATEKGVVGIINLNKSMTTWISIGKTDSPATQNLDPCDEFYELNAKKLVDLCVDKENNCVGILVVFFNKEKPEYKIELYALNENTNEMSLTKIINISQVLASTQKNHSEFCRIYLDEAERSFVLVDSANHKVFWFTPPSQIKRCIKCNDDSILRPTGLSLVPQFKSVYVCSEKGMCIIRPDNQSVKHDSLKPLDITYSKEDNSIYYIDEFGLYRNKLNEATSEFRYKKLFSNKSQNKGFKRVIASKNYIFIMSRDVNSLFVIEKEHLKL